MGPSRYESKDYSLPNVSLFDLIPEIKLSSLIKQDIKNVT
jgi:hypothetical protein